METKYNIVKQAVKSKIIDGTFTSHQKINSESELMKQFGVSRHTVRLAIGDLVNQGWLYREQGSGTYCADRSTQQTKTGSRQKNIAIITTYISDYIFPSIIRGAESILSEEGYQVSLFSTNNDHETERKLLEKILSQSFDGVIIEPTKSAYSNPNINYYLNLERLSIPYIMINAYYDELEPLSIVMDDERGGFMQTEHLIKLGHKDIIGCFKTDDLQGTKRMKGYLKAHREYQIPLNPKNIITYNTKEKQTKPINELQKLLSGNQDMPTGMVCYNDELAIKFLDVLREKSIHVPSDLSIVGYDDSFLAEVSEVKLTSVIHPKSEMGREAAKMIIELISLKESSKHNEMTKVESIVYPPEMAVRNSTKELNPLKIGS
ncbi:GntR family transcriptional regulator [Aquibacillus sp. 3ASR75-11]|uniref:GntR family transcriptional regulator n=1 Tax=Terrihalobacillus insolitus TaxID=2950438 RepID=A0A9X3WWW4_9BACI|nr:GntR family transcriptional regulator [Terrihalobacillus insolitus]MDC3425671.1 GntR family transcriptional regulator [Terrihalobacillus insolitus]